MLRFVLAAAVFSLSALALPAGGVSPAIAEDTIFRCGAESVSIGDSRYTVQKICGKPHAANRSGKQARKKNRSNRRGRLQNPPRGKFRSVTMTGAMVISFTSSPLKKMS